MVFGGRAVPAGTPTLAADGIYVMLGPGRELLGCAASLFASNPRWQVSDGAPPRSCRLAGFANRGNRWAD